MYTEKTGLHLCQFQDWPFLAWKKWKKKKKSTGIPVETRQIAFLHDFTHDHNHPTHHVVKGTTEFVKIEKEISFVESSNASPQSDS